MPQVSQFRLLKRSFNRKLIMQEALREIKLKEDQNVEAFKAWLNKSKSFDLMPFSSKQHLIDYVAGLHREIGDLEALNVRMHNQVSGYLDGKEWEHWQKFNKENFKVSNDQTTN